MKCVEFHNFNTIWRGVCCVLKFWTFYAVFSFSLKILAHNILQYASCHILYACVEAQSSNRFCHILHWLTILRPCVLMYCTVYVSCHFVSDVRKLKILGTKAVPEGDAVNLTCSIDSFPPSLITWTKLGSNKTLHKGITTELQSNMGMASLVIPNMTAENSGQYICTAKHLNNTLMERVDITCKYTIQLISDRKMSTCICYYKLAETCNKVLESSPLCLPSPFLFTVSLQIKCAADKTIKTCHETWIT